MSGAGLVFVVGAPRSGTTLLRTMLNRHPAFGLCDETYFFYYVATRGRAFGDLADPANRARAIAAYLATDRIRRLGLDLAALAAHLQQHGTSYPAMFDALLRFYAAAQGKQRAGEKTPHHAEHATTLLEWYPDARLVHLVRDPRDVVASLRRVPWGPRSAVLGARLWLGLVTAAERAAGSDRYLQVRYEDLIAAPEATLETVCGFLGEAAAPSMLEPEAGASTDKPWFARALGAVTKDRAGLWQSELTPEQVGMIEWIAGGAMQRFAYTATAPQPGAAARALGRLGATGETVSGKLRRLPRMWYYWARPAALAQEERWLDR